MLNAIRNSASNFYPRPPGGGRRSRRLSNRWQSAYFYPRPPGGGRRRTAALRKHRQRISIHALRVEGDRADKAQKCTYMDFYPRPPGGGRPSIPVIPYLSQRHFYPRPPGGGRPLGKTKYVCSPVFLSTPSGWRATIPKANQTNCNRISIHALRVEGDY